MDYIIYTYGGQGELIAQIFNGIARIFASDSAYFTSVGKFALSIGAVWAATRAIFNANIGIFGKEWFFPSFLAFTFLFTPKATVLIVDEALKHQYPVANIPFVVAFFSSVPSKISHYVAEEIEDQFNIPSNARSSHNGLMFGAKLVSKFKDIKIQDPILLENAKNFSKQCYLRPWIMGNILGKRQEAEATPDIMTWLRENKANNFGIYFKTPEGTTEFKSCPEVTDPILNAVEAEAKSPGVLGKFGMALGGGGNDLQQLARRMVETGDDALQTLAKENQSVHQWVKQSMMLNVYRESLDDWREGEGYQRLWPEVISMNATRGLYQQSFGWMTAGEMAAQFLPLLQTITFLMVVTAIFLVFPMALLPGGNEMLKFWIKAMIWVHTWPIFFAIINCIGISILASSGASQGEDFGLDKLSQGSFSDMLIHTYSAVQMFASMVPVFSWMLLSKSGYAFTSMVDRLSPGGTGAALGASTVDNTLQMDNVSYGNRQLSQQTVGPNLNLGSSIDDGALRVTQSAEGREFLQESTSNLATNFRGSNMESSALSQSYSEQESNMNALNTREGQTSSLEQSQMQDYAKRWMSNYDASQGGDESLSNAMRVVASGGVGSTETFGRGESKSTATNSGMDASVGFSVFGSGAKASTGTNATNTENLHKDQSAQETQQYQESLDQVRNYAQTQSMKEGVGTSETVSESLQNTWREQEQISQDKTETQQRMETLQSQMSHVQQNQSSVDQNWNDRVLEEIQQRHGLGNKQEALQWSNSHQGEGAQVLREMMDQKYGTAVSETISSKGADLSRTVGTAGGGVDYTSGSDSLKTTYENRTQEPQALKKNVEERLSAAQNTGSESNLKAEEFKEKMTNEGFGGQVKVETNPETTKKGLESKKADYERTSHSTYVRMNNETGKNIRDVGEGALNTYRKLSENSPILDLDSFLESSSEIKAENKNPNIKNLTGDKK